MTAGDNPGFVDSTETDGEKNMRDMMHHSNAQESFGQDEEDDEENIGFPVRRTEV